MDGTLRTSAHTLAIERGRYCGKPVDQRICTHCTQATPIQSSPAAPTPSGTSSGSTPETPQGYVDDEFYFLMKCDVFKTSRNCLFGKIASINPGFSQLNEEQQFSFLLTPESAQEAKVTSKFIKILFEWREKIDHGFPIKNLGIFFS